MNIQFYPNYHRLYPRLQLDWNDLFRTLTICIGPHLIQISFERWFPNPELREYWESFEYFPEDEDIPF